MEITLVNLILAVIILLLGIWAYAKTSAAIALYAGIAFGLFGVSHLLTLLGLAGGLTVPLIAVRTIAYLLVIFALYRILAQKQGQLG